MVEKYNLKPKVSIVIPVYNQIEYTKMCLKSIKRHTDVDYEIIVINNGSIDDTEEYLQRQQNIISIHNKTNLGYPKAINQGIAIARGDYIILLNNDCIVTKEWVKRLIKASNIPRVGIVGVMSNYAQHPQLIMLLDYDIENIDKITKQIQKKYDNRYFYVTRILGFCMLIKKEVIKKIGGFDDTFGMGFFEDDDFSLRAILSGYKNIIARDVFVYHYGSATFKKENIRRDKLLNENWKVFKRKWGLSNNVVLQKNDYLSKLNFKFLNRMNKRKIHIPLKKE
ncbi:glycosyltransferase family 2 protein [Clostridiaceae bacterium M8S5]|nr:glycosyltransferase family 2 protein [Clostridiaceae bacterium M8S5]